MLIALAAGLLSTATFEAPNSDRDIVVIGRRIKDAEDALKSCLARQCPPNEDIDATLVLAETQIVAGEYRDARTTLLRSLGRNKHVADRYPVPLSELYRANGKVAAHLGFDKDYYRSTWGIFRSLKDGIPAPDERHFTARMEIAQMVFRTRGHTRARLYYESIADDARKAGRPDIAAMAELRSILHHLPPYMRESRIRKIADSKDPAIRGAALQAKLALARMAFERGDLRTAETIHQQFATFNIKRPILIYSPPYELAENDSGSRSEFGIDQNAAPGSGGLGNPEGPNGGRTVTSSLPVGLFSATKRVAPIFDDMWVDVGFRVMPDGRVADVKILRSRGDTFWSKPLIASISGRRYTPGRPGDSASQRVERYTYTSGYEGKTDSRMDDRSPQGRVEYMDLSRGGISTPE